MSIINRLKLRFTGSGVTVTTDDAGRDVVEITGGGGGGGPETDPIASAALTTHEADTTNVHGITDTSALVVTTDPRLSDARTPTAHDHDTRYYTETEVDTALAGKAASVHTHDDRYYTETEVDTALAGKLGTAHEADTTNVHGIVDTTQLVLTTDARLSDARTPTAHTHDDRYFTETESDARFAPVSHGHPFTAITGTATDAQIPSTIARDTEVTAAIDAHKADTSDMHPQYQKESEKGAASGYAPLDSGLLVPLANIPSHDIITKHNGFPGGTTNFLRADGTWAAPAGGGGGPTESATVLGANHANSTVTPGAVTGLAATLGVGTWLAKYWLVYQTAATTTGIQMYLDHTGTTTRLAGTWYQLTTGGAATTGIGDQATTTVAQMLEGKGQRADNVASGTTQGVDTANADQFAVFEALIVVTVSGTLNLMMNSEVAGSAATIMAGSTLALTKVA